MKQACPREIHRREARTMIIGC